MRIEAFEAGTVNGNQRFMRADGWRTALWPSSPISFPVYFFVVELADGITLIDTGLDSRVRVPGWQRRVVPAPAVRAFDEAGPALAAVGIDPSEIRRIILTHMDWDHAGGLRHFPDAEVLVHRPELEFASSLPGRLRYQSRLWPVAPRLKPFDLVAEQWGPFGSSLRIADGLVAVPLPGHTIGQVGIACERGGDEPPVLLTADHFLRLDWFREDLAAGNPIGLGIFFADQARVTGELLGALLEGGDAELIATHDAETPRRLRELAVGG